MPVSELSKDSIRKPGDFTKVKKRTEWTGEYAYNLYSFSLKNYWFESVFSRSKKKKKHLSLKLIMAVVW